jgi:hypothetical protein
VEASAKTAHNVEEAFFETGRKIVDMIKAGELDVKDEVNHFIELIAVSHLNVLPFVRVQKTGIQEGMKIGKGGKGKKKVKGGSGCCA